MGKFLSYSIISGLLMLAMYLAYRLFLARDNQHGFNRGILLIVYFVSFLASPFLYFMNGWNIGSDSPLLTFEGAEIVAGAVVPASKPVWGTIMIWIFIIGMVVVAVRTVITWVRLTTVIRSGKKIEYGCYTLVVTDNEKFAPFSWMHYIVISCTDYENDCRAIIAHELKHVVSRHWIDLFIAQIICIINWFNPVAWLMRDELMLVHEYQADMAVIDSGHDTQEYQMLLIKKAVGARFQSMANSLNHSKLKKRITMMYKEKSGAGRRFKALALVPMLALALGVAGVPAVRAAVSTISNSGVAVGKGSENPVPDQTGVRNFKVTNINNNGKETSVVILGKGLGESLTVSGGTFTNNGKTYQANSLKFDMNDGNAVITVTFPFSDEYKDASMTITVNGEEIPFILEEFFNNSQAITLHGTPSALGSATQISVIGSGSGTPSLDGMEIYIDGEKVDGAELANLPAEKIASMTIDRQNNAIRITTK